MNVFELDPATFQVRRRIFAARATWEATENAWVLTGGWVRDFGNDGRVVRYEPFKATSLAELTEPPGYFRREVRQYYQMNWRQLGQYIASLRQAGFDTARPARSSGSLGLIGMRERAEAIDGRMVVDSAPGQGTRVIVEAPRAAPVNGG